MQNFCLIKNFILYFGHNNYFILYFGYNSFLYWKILILLVPNFNHKLLYWFGLVLYDIHFIFFHKKSKCPFNQIIKRRIFSIHILVKTMFLTMNDDPQFMTSILNPMYTITRLYFFYREEGSIYIKSSKTLETISNSILMLYHL